jgi:hypothetical protein
MTLCSGSKRKLELIFKKKQKDEKMKNWKFNLEEFNIVGGSPICRVQRHLPLVHQVLKISAFSNSIDIFAIRNKIL